MLDSKVIVNDDNYLLPSRSHCWILVYCEESRILFPSTHILHMCSSALSALDCSNICPLGCSLFYLLCDNVLNWKLVLIFLRHIFVTFFRHLLIEFMTLCVCVCVKKNIQKLELASPRASCSHIYTCDGNRVRLAQCTFKCFILLNEITQASWWHLIAGSHFTIDCNYTNSHTFIRVKIYFGIKLI